MSRQTDSIRVGPPPLRRFWMKITAWVGDHPVTSLLGVLIVAGTLLYYGLRLHGFAHMGEALNRWRIEVFGGTYHVDRSIEVPDVILSLRQEKYDKLDALSGSAGFMGGTAFRREIRALAMNPGASLRVVALDPRLANASHPHHAAFVAAGESLGFKSWEYAARCQHSAAVLLHLLDDFAPALEVRLLDGPLPSAPPPSFAGGRSVQLYRHDNPSTRLDIIVPKPGEPDGMDSFCHPGLIIRDRPDDPEVKRFSAIFEEAWGKAKPLDAAARAEILHSLTSSP